MTRKEFMAVPWREWNDVDFEFDSLIIIPGTGRDRLHDSGYRRMYFVAVKDGKPFCLLSGCSDVIHVNGIGGYGDDWLDKFKGIPTLVPPIPWSIDCLAKSGLLRMFVHDHVLKAGPALSSFEIYAKRRSK